MKKRILKFNSNVLNNRGVIYLSVLVIFGSCLILMSTLVQKYTLQVTSLHYLERAHERQEIELRAMRCILNPDCYDLVYEQYQSDVDISFLAEEVVLEVTGKHNFRVDMILDLDKFIIISYNYTEFDGG